MLEELQALADGFRGPDGPAESDVMVTAEQMGFLRKHLKMRGTRKGAGYQVSAKALCNKIKDLQPDEVVEEDEFEKPVDSESTLPAPETREEEEQEED